jgi:hypothetical protein
LRLESQLAAPVRVRANQAFMHAAHLQWKQLCGLLTQGPGLRESIGVEIDMGVVALDLLHLKPL